MFCGRFSIQIHTARAGGRLISALIRSHVKAELIASAEFVRAGYRIRRKGFADCARPIRAESVAAALNNPDSVGAAEFIYRIESAEPISRESMFLGRGELEEKQSGKLGPQTLGRPH